MKRIISLILTISLVLLIAPLSAFADTDYSGYIEISDKSGLNAIRDNLSGKYVLTADIEFTSDDFAEGGDFYNEGAGWAPIGNKSSPFTGVLDGNGHKISGLKINVNLTSTQNRMVNYYYGLFGYTLGGAVNNLSMLDSDISVKISNSAQGSSKYDSIGSRIYLGGIIGYCDESSASGCNVSGKIYAYAHSFPGLACGYTFLYIGGVVGMADYAALTDCFNTASIETTGMSRRTNYSSYTYDYVGGVVGYMYFSALDGAYNTGSITDYVRVYCNNSSLANMYGYSHIGGVIGYSTNSTASELYNTGSVSSKILSDISATAHAGGVIGYLYQAGIHDAYNTGTVYSKAVAVSSDKVYVGGIAGYSSNIGENPYRNCYNVGAVSGSSARNIYVAGITGYLNETVMTNCYYLSNISAGVASGSSGCDTAIRRSQSQLGSEAGYGGFDFDSVWIMGSCPDYTYAALSRFAKAHNWDEGAVIGIPSCGSTGSALYQCTECSASFTKTIPKLTEHSGDTELRNQLEPDCDVPGYTGDIYCLTCNGVITYGSDIPETENHIDADGLWEYNANSHWHTCKCGEILDLEAHYGGVPNCTELGYCVICEQEYGDTDPQEHHGETELRGRTEPKCNEKGYTGDLYCLDCNKVITYGTFIPATENHIDADGFWEYDENNHWHTCECEKIIVLDSHSGGVATCKDRPVCEICGQEHGSLDGDNHVGGTELRGDYPAECNTDGYTGDIFCLGCGDLLERGEYIPATEDHIDTDGLWEHDINGHWHTCHCGTAFDGDSHTFINYIPDNNATYDSDGTKTAKCEYCDEYDTVADLGSKLIRIGDINGDGEITYIDYMLLKRAVMGTYPLDDTQKISGDINNDGAITYIDYMLLKRAVMGTYEF